MGITYKDVALLQQGLESLRSGFKDRQDQEDRNLERTRRNELEKELLDLRKSEAQERTADRRSAAENRAKDLEDSRENRRLSLEVQKQRAADAMAHEQRLEGFQKEQADWRKTIHESNEFKSGLEQLKSVFEELSTGVQKGSITPDAANRAAKDIVDQIQGGASEMLKNSPFAKIMGGGALFSSTPATTTEKLQYSEDPVSGERQVLFNGQIRGSGSNPEVAARAKRLMEEQERTENELMAAKAQLQQLEALKAGGAKFVKKSSTGKWEDAGSGWFSLGEIGIDDAIKQQSTALPTAPAAEEPSMIQPAAPAAVQPAQGRQPKAPQSPPQAPPQGERQTGAMHGVARPRTREEALRLPRGVKFLNPADGKVYIKQ